MGDRICSNRVLSTCSILSFCRHMSALVNRPDKINNDVAVAFQFQKVILLSMKLHFLLLILIYMLKSCSVYIPKLALLVTLHLSYFDTLSIPRKFQNSSQLAHLHHKLSSLDCCFSQVIIGLNMYYQFL